MALNAYNISYSYDAVGNRTLLASSRCLDHEHFQRGQRAGDQPDRVGRDDEYLRRLGKPSDISGTGQPADDEHVGRREPADAGGLAGAAIVDTFAYNGDGQRVQKQDSTGTTKHLWDGQNILLETNASNVVQVVYTLKPELYGNLISQRRSGSTSFYLFDGLGSTSQLANNTGSVTDNYLYDSFGNILLSGSTVTNFKYVGASGYYNDPDLLTYYIKARHYSPTIGRFLSRDPLDRGLIANVYRYVRNNAIRFSDPSGLFDPFLGWEYGNYCGWYKTGIDPNNPSVRLRPKDALDEACRDHDLCQATWWTCNPWDIIRCSRRLCSAASEAWRSGCAVHKPRSRGV